MSAKALLERGFCCGLKCTNCPYTPKYQKGNKKKYPYNNDNEKNKY